MAKFCYKCGNELKEGIKFCPKCGTQVRDAASPNGNVQGQGDLSEAAQYQHITSTQGGTTGGVSQTAVLTQQRKLPKNTLIWLGAAAVVIIALVIGGMKLFGEKPYEKPWKCLEKGINNRDMKTILKAFPKDQESVLSSAFEIYNQLGGEEIDFSALLGEEMNEAKVHFDVTNADKVKKSELKEELANFGVSEKQLAQIDAAYLVDVDCIAQYQGETETEEVSDVPVVKIDGRWCLPIDFSAFSSLDSLF